VIADDSSHSECATDLTAGEANPADCLSFPLSLASLAFSFLSDGQLSLGDDYDIVVIPSVSACAERMYAVQFADLRPRILARCGDVLP
jgi:hypothetical protein